MESLETYQPKPITKDKMSVQKHCQGNNIYSSIIFGEISWSGDQEFYATHAPASQVPNDKG